MNIIIIGAGTIGASIADLLVRTGRDVIVIDHDKSALEELESSLDVQTICGHGCDPAILGLAQADKCDLLLALTNHEEVNMLAATVAKHMGTRQTVARVRSSHYLVPDDFDFRQALNIDLTISPEVLTAAEIVKFLDNPDALALEFYAQGRVQLIQFELDSGHEYAGRKIRELRLPGGVLITLVSRNGEILIPNGETLLEQGDKITLLGKSGTLNSLRKQTTRKSNGIFSTVVVAGGGETGSLLAAAIENRVRTCKVLEIDMTRCRQLGGILNKAVILNGDATRRQFLHEERINKADCFIAAMHSDEDNIMAALLAKKMGVGKCVAVVKRSDYTPLLLETTSIDLALSPREVTANKIIALVKRGKIQNISLIEDGRAEIVEFNVSSASPLIGKPLKELSFPKGSLVGMIGRGKQIRIAQGDDVIHANDTVIMVTLSEVAEEVEALF